MELVSAPSSKQHGCSIVIPTRDQTELLSSCIDSIERSRFTGDYELIVVDNDSVSSTSRRFLADLESSGRAKVLLWPGAFNFSAILNAAATHASHDVLCFLNDDIEVLDVDWLESLGRELRTRPVLVRRGGEFDRWDLQVECGVLGGVRITTAVEEHGQGKQLIRFALDNGIDG